MGPPFPGVVFTLPINTVVQGNAADCLRTFPPESVDVPITSPAYWKLRAYETVPQEWGGRPDCRHRWDVPDERVHCKCRAGFEPGVVLDPFMGIVRMARRRIEAASAGRAHVSQSK